ncbi:MAG TPA: CHASE2 domain-containing protein [Usitatibacter sp.]|nr:CHASE2 domain-containing protein [Usitatibacter sp.]
MGALGGLRVTALVLLAALSLFIIFSPLAQALRLAMFDTYQRLFPLEREQAPVAVVLIDENSIARLGQWPWPRTRIAYLVDRIHAHGPLAIGLDLIFPEPDRYSPGALAAELPVIPSSLQQLLESLPTNDQRFADAIRGKDVVLGISAERVLDDRFNRPPRPAPVALAPQVQATLHKYPGHIASVPVVDAAAESRGIMNSGPQDQVVRQVPLLAEVQGALVPSLGVETFRVAVGERLKVAARAGGLAEVAAGKFRVTMQDDGHTWLRFSRHTYAFSVPAVEVMTGAVDPAMLRDRIVLVGVSGLGVLDFKTTALGEFIPGVYVHAQVMENLYNGVSLVRPDWAVRAEAAVLLLCGLILIAFVPRLSAMQGINVAFGLVVLIAGAGFIAFVHFSMLFDPMWPAIGTMAVFGSVVVGTLSETERQRRVLREEAAHLAGEVDAARRIQMGLLPDPRETLSHDRRFAIAAMLEPARTVGGDFYDCFMVDARRLFLIVADVSGKGLPAALFMAAAKSHLKSAALRERQIGEVLTRAQDEIARENPEQLFVTAFAGILDVHTGALEYANAGHEPPFRRRPDGVPERFGLPGGPPLCVVEDFEYPTERTQLVPGEWVVIVTDGATEAMNPARGFFGLERLRTSLSWMPREASPTELIRKLDEDVKKFAAGAEAADDLTLLAFRWEGVSDRPVAGPPGEASGR